MTIDRLRAAWERQMALTPGSRHYEITDAIFETIPAVLEEYATLQRELAEARREIATAQGAAALADQDLSRHYREWLKKANGWQELIATLEERNKAEVDILQQQLDQARAAIRESVTLLGCGRVFEAVTLLNGQCGHPSEPHPSDQPAPPVSRDDLHATYTLLARSTYALHDALGFCHTGQRQSILDLINDINALLIARGTR